VAHSPLPLVPCLAHSVDFSAMVVGISEGDTLTVLKVE
jgi:hypothetical protein